MKFIKYRTGKKVCESSNVCKGAVGQCLGHSSLHFDVNNHQISMFIIISQFHQQHQVKKVRFTDFRLNFLRSSSNF